MTTISASTVLRSRNTSRRHKVLSTLLLRYPRWIHAELMTHRVLSRNAASSRAIPILKMIKSMFADPAHPTHWGRNAKGMQAHQQLAGWRLMLVKFCWYLAMTLTAIVAYAMHLCGAHKQIVNRLLEPFTHITVLVSATEWNNFLALRDHPDAEPHICILAKAVKECLDHGDVQDLVPGDWHMPFLTENDWAEADAFDRHCSDVFPNPDEPRTSAEIALEGLRRKSSACCASTSFKTVEGFEMDTDKAEAIYARLVEKPPLHASPFEHVARVDIWRSGMANGVEKDGWAEPELHGNFLGFSQWRRMLPNHEVAG